jgi:coenzyme F420-dependent glucose-6-phosphate dehydrogenase
MNNIPPRGCSVSRRLRPRPASSPRCARITFTRGAIGKGIRDFRGVGSAQLFKRAQCRSVPSAPPGQRYHPAVIAQAAATLSEMFPDRFWLAVGSGEALNESITGQLWPPKHQRNLRLLEAVKIIRALWAGATVTTRDFIVREAARLYSRPLNPPQLLGAALSPETAQWVGSWADGLITVAGPREDMREVVEAFRKSAGEAKPMFLQVAVSFARTDEEAASAAVDQWRHSALPAD